MKKFFTLVAAVLCSMNMMAKDYQGNLNVQVPSMFLNINQDATISVTEETEGEYRLTIKDFSFQGMLVGTIDVSGVKVESELGDVTQCTYTGETTILPSSNPEDQGMLANQKVELDLTAQITDNLIYTEIYIKAGEGEEALNVTVTFNNTQIPNSGFEDYHDMDMGKQEPNHWHSFGSSTGSLSGIVKKNYNIAVSDDVRQGDEESNSSKSIKILSTLQLGSIPANGTLTTGRLKAAGFTPTSTDNCAFLDMSQTDVDNNKDPFYTTLNAMPDSISAWVKFKRGGADADYEITDAKGKGTGEFSRVASVSAVITDGTYYQDPQDKDYTNIVATAKGSIEETNGEWKKITVPFTYNEESLIDPKAILVTFGTNAYPGVASKNAESPDELLVDDVKLIYNPGIKSIKFKGQEVKIASNNEGTIMNANSSYSLQDFDIETNGAGAFYSAEIEHVYDEDMEEWGYELHVVVFSGDLAEIDPYIIYINGSGTPTGIKNAAISTPKGIEGIYNLAGQKVSSMQKGQVYVVKYTNGETKKVVKK